MGVRSVGAAGDAGGNGASCIPHTSFFPQVGSRPLQAVLPGSWNQESSLREVHLLSLPHLESTHASGSHSAQVGSPGETGQNIFLSSGSRAARGAECCPQGSPQGLRGAFPVQTHRAQKERTPLT